MSPNTTTLKLKNNHSKFKRYVCQFHFFQKKEGYVCQLKITHIWSYGCLLVTIPPTNFAPFSIYLRWSLRKRPRKT